MGGAGCQERGTRQRRGGKQIWGAESGAEEGAGEDPEEGGGLRVGVLVGGVIGSLGVLDWGWRVDCRVQVVWLYGEALGRLR